MSTIPSQQLFLTPGLRKTRGNLGEYKTFIIPSLRLIPKLITLPNRPSYMVELGPKSSYRCRTRKSQTNLIRVFAVALDFKVHFFPL